MTGKSMKKDLAHFQSLERLKAKDPSLTAQNPSSNQNGSKKKKKNKKSQQQNGAINGHSNGIIPTKRPLVTSPQPIPAKKQKQMKQNAISEPNVLIEKKSLKPQEIVPELIEDETVLNPLGLATNFVKELIEPLCIDDFFKNYFEKRIFYSPNKSNRDFGSLFSTEVLDTLLSNERIMYGEHIDVTSYTDGVRETVNPEGRAFRSSVWDHYSNGCSVRMLCPQAFYEPLQKVLSFMQEFFGCFVGANTYLTPPSSQGFAPHWDDIEAFVLQIEGEKRWKIYKPRNEDENLPFYSSRDFKEDEIDKPIFDKVLYPGDVLYFPRGYIHQACTPKGDDAMPSLHITISTYQKFTWTHFLNKYLSLGLSELSLNQIAFREGLPLRVLKNLGGSHYRSSKSRRSNESLECEHQVRQTLIKHLKTLTEILEDENNDLGRRLVHHSADQMALELVRDSLPPITDFVDVPDECVLQSLPAIYQSIEYDASNGIATVNKQLPFYESLGSDNGDDVDPELSPDDEIRLIRWSAARVINKEIRPADGYIKRDEDDLIDDKSQCILTHCTSNSKIYQEYEPESVSMEKEFLPAWDEIVLTYPNFVKIENLPLDSVDEKIRFATILYEMGVIVINRPGLQWDEETSETNSECDQEQHSSDGNISSEEIPETFDDDEDDDDDESEEEIEEDEMSQGDNEIDESGEDSDDYSDLDDEEIQAYLNEEVKKKVIKNSSAMELKSNEKPKNKINLTKQNFKTSKPNKIKK